MTIRNHHPKADTTAAGYYLRLAEAALGIATRKPVDLARVVRRIDIQGCKLYIPDAMLWKRHPSRPRTK